MDNQTLLNHLNFLKYEMYKLRLKSNCGLLNEFTTLKDTLLYIIENLERKEYEKDHNEPESDEDEDEDENEDQNGNSDEDEED
jgi:hypothetical protein